MAAGVYTGGGATVVMDPPPVVYVKVFHTGSEPDRRAKRNAQKVAMMARSIAPVRSGLLAQSIRVDPNRDEKGWFTFGYKVYTNVRYAHYVHEGTAPHVYFTFPGKMKFEGTNHRAGDIVVTDMINHPGNSANPFLQDALVAMVL